MKEQTQDNKSSDQMINSQCDFDNNYPQNDQIQNFNNQHSYQNPSQNYENQEDNNYHQMIYSQYDHPSNYPQILQYFTLNHDMHNNQEGDFQREGSMAAYENFKTDLPFKLEEDYSAYPIQLKFQ
ncbi:hypothetical protein ABPG72_005947 [Tetrahymena utriculariae]